MENNKHLKNLFIVNTLPLCREKHFLSCKYFFDVLGGDRGKFPTTPPPCKKHQTGLQQPADVYPLTKSKSHESQLANRVEGADNLSK